ncbi:host-nuclease inhibitor Gam family protein [Nitratidesulfovibrio vulgaris]|uniref:host-nuclease inhibitor Gam family protein n=1 Tax=Nitratidesulfovibrio vulgaris TaxID=881 RepID=UPI0013E043E9|nr:host-nuclease inhibitor Gam family protein [Nitratidesulfovibrio vulgaris]
MSRRKPNPVIVADIRQAEGALAEIATIDRKVSEIEAQMNEAIDAAKARASQKSAPLLIKEDVNKEAMQGWPDERLEMVGLKRRTTDAFYIEINREEVADTAA